MIAKNVKIIYIKNNILFLVCVFISIYFNFCWGQNSETYEVNVTIYILKIFVYI